MRRLEPLAPVLATMGAALIVAIWIAVVDGGAGLRAGAVFPFHSPERWLALVAAGFCVATQPPRTVGVAGAFAVCGVALGLIAPDTALWPWITSAEVFPALHFLGPGACLLVGLALLGTARWRRLLLPPALFAVTAALSLTAALNDPALQGVGFAAGAMLSALALVPAAAILRCLVAGPWTAVGERIAGSWLLTIGLLLCALRLAPAPLPTVELAPPATTPVWNAPDVPGFVAPAQRGADPFAGPAGHGGFPMGTN